LRRSNEDNPDAIDSRLRFSDVPLVRVVKAKRAITLGRLKLELLMSLIWIPTVALVLFIIAMSMMKERLIAR